MQWRCKTLILLTLVLAAWTAAAAGPPAAPRLVQTEGDYRAGWLQLRGDGGATTPLWLALRDGKVTAAWLAGSTLCGLDGPARTYVNEIAVQIKDGRLTGVLKLRRQRGRFGAEPVGVRLDLAVGGDSASGTWQVMAAGQTAKGTAAGAFQPADAVRRAELLADDASWPTKLGPTWDGLAAPSNSALIDDLREARPVWRSEDYLPTGWGNGPDSRYLHRAQLVGVCGGATTPIVANGRVYCFYYEANRPLEPMDAKLPAYSGSHRKEPVSNNEILADLKAKGGFTASHPTEIASLIRWHAVRADHVVVCLDAATGQTLWKSVWPLKTVNHQTHKWRGFNPSPTIVDDTLYVCDYTSRLYAYDAATGALRWSFDDFAREDWNGSPWPMPVVIGDIVVVGGSKGVAGLDVRSGKPKWTAEGGAMSARPIGIDGKDRLLVLESDDSPAKGISVEAGKVYTDGLEASRVRLLDPTNGSLLWEKTLPMGCKGPTPIVLGERIITQQSLGFIKRTSGGNRFQRLTCWRVTGAGIEKSWDSEMMDSNDTIALAPAGKLLVAIDNTAIRHLDLGSGKTIQTLSEGEGRGLLRTACSHAVAGNGKMIYQPEGHHGTQWLYLLPLDPGAMRLPKEADAWYPPHIDTTAYSQDPIVNPLVDGRLFLRGADGIYCYDLRKEANR